MMNSIVIHKEFKSAPDFLRHREMKHPQLVPKCKNYVSEEYPFVSMKCWLMHDTEDNNEDEIDDKKLENNQIVQKMFKMME